MKARLMAFTLAGVLLAAPIASAQSVAPTDNDPLLAHALPVAAGALIGAAAGFFILPLLVPALASATPITGTTVSSPLIGLASAGLGGLLAYKVAK